MNPARRHLLPESNLLALATVVTRPHRADATAITVHLSDSSPELLIDNDSLAYCYSFTFTLAKVTVYHKVL